MVMYVYYLIDNIYIYVYNKKGADCMRTVGSHDLDYYANKRRSRRAGNKIPSTITTSV